MTESKTNILVFDKEVGWFKKLIPRCLPNHDLLSDGKALLKFLLHDSASRYGDIEGRILLWVCRCDNGHQVVAVCNVYLKYKIAKHVLNMFHRDIQFSGYENKNEAKHI
jgi:hypothetical protein